MKNGIANLIKRCSICLSNNRKNKAGYEDVETTRTLEKVGIDIAEIEGKYVLLAVDFYTRFLLARIIEGKSSASVIKVMNEWCRDNRPEEIVTDNGREFTNGDFRKLCVKFKIKHRTVSFEAHNSNGRVERIIKTIREALVKKKDLKMEVKLNDVVEVYNNSYHRAIKRTPYEAMSNNDNELLERNSRYCSYADGFKMKNREKFKMNQKVLTTKKENIKEAKGRFTEEGKIVSVLENDSYLIRGKDGKITKKRYYDLKSCEM